MNWLKALKLLFAMQAGSKSVAIQEESLKTSAGVFQYDLYTSGKRQPNTPLIIFLHGMSLAGHRDKRVVEFCKALSTAGFTIAAPFFPEVQNTEITPQSIKNLTSFTLALSKIPDFSASPISLVAPSFSGTVALLSATDKRLRDRIRSVLAIGAFASIDSGLRALVVEEGMDEYARLVFLRNYAEVIFGKDKARDKVLEAMISDNWHQRKEEELLAPPLFEKLAAAKKKTLSRLLNDKKFREEFFEKFIQKEPKQLNLFNLIKNSRQIQAEVFLLHGKNDHVIPPSESILLRDTMEARGQKVRLLITPLLSHGDTKLSFHMIFDIWQLLRIFTRFFASLK